jgi:hypothetical protein
LSYRHATSSGKWPQYTPTASTIWYVFAFSSLSSLDITGTSRARNQPFGTNQINSYSLIRWAQTTGIVI